MNIKVVTSFNLCGAFPSEMEKRLISAVESIATNCFFDSSGNPLKKEVDQVDRTVAEYLQISGWGITTNYAPFSDNSFNVDLAVPDKKLLIEIEKGKLPRLELDIIKIASSCLQFSQKWEYGALIVPASYIQLALAGGQSPAQYLERLSPLVRPLLEKSHVKALLVIGYNDPRK